MISAPTMIVASSACERRRINGVAPMAYAYHLLGTKEMKWGYAAERHTQLMIGRAITRACHEIYLECEPDYPIEIVARKIGFEKYFKEYVPRWIEQDIVGKKHGGAEWREVNLLGAISGAQVRTPLPVERTLVRKVTCFVRHVRDIADVAFSKDRSLYKREGTILTDDAPDAPVLATELS